MGKRNVYKCLSYGNAETPETDWNEAHIACKEFGKTPPKIPVFFSGFDKPEKIPEEIEGQMKLSDFITFI